MALNNPLLNEKLHYSAPSGGGGGYHHGGGGGYGYGSATHLYSSIGSGYGSSGHESHSQKGGSKKSVALSALTLLAFLFFLHILQTCIQEQHANNNPNTTTFIVMAARAENRQDIMKKRKGDVEEIDADYAEKKSSTTNWEEMDKRVVTTRVKTFTKYDQPDHV